MTDQDVFERMVRLLAPLYATLDLLHEATDKLQKSIEEAE